MKVKIKGISELERAKYVFDNSGNLVGVRLDVDSERGIRKYTRWRWSRRYSIDLMNKLKC